MGYAAYPDGRDVAALTYDQEAGEKKRTLHELAAAALENQRLKAPPTQSSTQQWTSKIASADDPAAALKALQGKAAAGSVQAKELTEARENIAAVLAQSSKDMALRKSVLKAARTDEGTGNSWNALLKRQVGPHSLALASDWLSTEEATTRSKNKKAMLARAQLAAALSQVGGHFGGREEEEGEERRRGERGGRREEEGGMRSEAAAPTGRYGGQEGEEGEGGGGARPGWGAEGGGQGGQGGQPAMPTGAVPGLSSYDAQILANGPPG